MTAAEPEKTTPVQESQKQFNSLDDLFVLYQPYLANLSAYQPVYFLVGANPEESKFQLSLKYQFFNKENPLAIRRPWLKGFHFGYTQTSYWDLESDSAPFEDTSYKPEFFYLTDNLTDSVGTVKAFFVQAGIQHESNGRDEEESRSTNFLYAKPIFIFYSENSRYGLQIAPKFWTYVHNEETNEDLKDYRGYFDLELKLGSADSWVFSSNIRWAKEGFSSEWNATYPLDRIFTNNLNLYFHAQYVNALAESLLDYRKRTEAFRFGFSVVR